MQFTGKLSNQTWENGKKTPDFGPDSRPNLVPKNVLCVLPVLDVINCCKWFQRKLMNQTWENGKKPRFGPNFGPVGPNSDCQFFFFFFPRI